jgi:hypothetical protein
MRALLIRLGVLTGSLVAGLGAGGAHAADGVHEIDQVCASGAGCFAGDTPGFPVQITAPGSYRLTGGLSLPDENTGAIELATHDVSIDLGGFAIRGVVACQPNCTPTGSGQGIYGLSGGRYDRIAVRGGSVAGMGSDGIVLGEAALVVDVRAIENAGDGIRLLTGVVTRCNANANASKGIVIDDAGSLSDSSADDNGFGFSTLGTATVRSVASNNGQAGFFSGFGVVADSSAVANGRGFQIGGVLTRSTTRSNTSYGVLAWTELAVSSLTARANGSEGMSFTLAPGSGYRGAIVSNNGATVNGGLALDGNLCNGSATCP